jgi:GntR family transcriptional regulator
MTAMEAVTGKLRRLETRPLGEQAKEALLDSIGSGGFPDGTLPSEERLAEMLGISRTTLRDALRSLEEEGVVSRHHGVGTRVNQHVVRATPLSRLSGFYALIRDAGHEPRIARTEIRTDIARGEMASRLQRSEGTPLYLVERLFLADAEPAVHLVEHLPVDEAAVDIAPDDVPDSIFEFAETFCRTPIDHTLVEIVPASADEADIAVLPSLRPGDPFLRLIETHYTGAGRPLMVSEIRVVDQFLRFTVVRKRA